MKYIELEICLNFTLVLKSIRRWVRWGKKELGTNREWQTLTHYVIIFLPPQIIISISHPCSTMTKLFNITIESKTHHLRF